MTPILQASASRQFKPSTLAPGVAETRQAFKNALPSYGRSNPHARAARANVIKTAGFLGQRTSANFMFGMGNKSYGRLGLAGGLGIMAIGQAGKSIDRAQYGNYTGAALSAGMAGAAGAAAYSAYHLKSSYRNHLSNAASKIMKNIFR